MFFKAVKGIVRENMVIIENEDLYDYDGSEVVVTFLDQLGRKRKKESVDWNSFVIPSERGKNVDAYMREMREDDRL